MARKQPKPGKKYFTPAEANAALPLVRAIALDIVDLARDLRDRHERLSRLKSSDEQKRPVDSYEEELAHMRAEFERGQERMQEYVQELQDLGVELKDFFTGLLDFPCWMNQREVYLCWKLGEPEVAHWHEIDAGFSGRQKLTTSESSPPKSGARI